MSTRLWRLVLLPLLASGCHEVVAFPEELVAFGPAEELLAPLGPGTWEAVFRERGFVLREGDEYRLWYTGAACATCQGKLGYATSSDGRTFRRAFDAPIYDATWLEDTMVVPHD